MPSSKPGITLNKTELKLIRAGLDLIHSRLAGAGAGFFPHCHPLNRINFQASAVYEKQAYDKEMAGQIVALSRKLAATPSPRKVRLDAFEAAAAALALRVTGKKRLWSQVLGPGTEVVAAERIASLRRAILALGKKLENCRRRARSVAIKHLSQSVYDEHFKRWQAFVQWIRYNLLYDADMPIVRRLLTRNVFGPTRQTWKYQRLTLLEMAREVVAERTTAVIPEGELHRLVRLAKEELRRGRHDILLTEAIKDRKKGKEILFKFITKRFDLYEHIKFESADLSVQQSIRGEKFRKSIFVSEDPGTHVPSTQPCALRRAGVGTDKALGTNDYPTPKPTVPAAIVPLPETDEERRNLVAAGKALYIPARDVSREVASLLQKHSGPLEWGQFIEKAEAEISHLESPLPVTRVRSVEFFTLQGLFERCCPGKPPNNGHVENITYLINWILKVMTVLYRTPEEIRRTLASGVREAERQISPWAWYGW
jgi:hypothetical protein